MKIKEFTVSAELGAVIGTGYYENERIRVSESVTFETGGETPEKSPEELIEIMIKRLYLQVEHQEQVSRQKAIEKRYKDIRWYPVEGNGKYPSVTSVIDTANPIEWHVTENQLRGLAARGNVLDMILQKYIETGEWSEPKNIPEIFADYEVMKKEGYDLEGDLPAFIEKYKVKFTEGHVTVISNKHKYAGSLDAVCTMEGSDLITVGDLKAFNPDKESKIRVAKQMAAYAKAYEETFEVKIDRCVVFPIHGKTQQGYSKPMYVNDIDKAFEMFLDDRQKFKDLFNI